jgi:HD-like signal output (HDOD) protein
MPPVDPAPSVEKLLDRISEVCPLPASVQRVIALTNEAEVDLRQVVEAIASDPGLAAEVMRVANSPVFGYSRKVEKLPQAIVTLGFRELNAMATAMALLAMFRSKDELSLHLHDYGLVAATLARRIAKEMRTVDASFAYLSGLLSEIGAMACLAIDADAYLGLWEDAYRTWDGTSLEPWSTRGQYEVARYGATTPVIGARLLRRNLVPEAVAAAIEASTDSDPSALSDPQRVAAASRVLSMIVVRAGKTNHPELLSSVAPVVAARFALTAIPPDRLGALCIDAAGDAEQLMRRTR